MTVKAETRKITHRLVDEIANAGGNHNDFRFYLAVARAFTKLAIDEITKRRSNDVPRMRSFILATNKLFTNKTLTKRMEEVTNG